MKCHSCKTIDILAFKSSNTSSFIAPIFLISLDWETDLI